MKKELKIFVIAFLFLIAVNNIADLTENNLESTKKTYSYNVKNIECLYYNETDFMNVYNYETTVYKGFIQGCILPHHLVAKDLIHEVFQNLEPYKEKYKNVVLIGPDHESIDKGKIFTTLSNWQTPTGILKTNTKITKELLKNDFIIESDTKLTKEHSTSSIIPFIKFYLEDANVITLVLTKQVKLEDVNKLVNSLYENLNIEETLFIASVDFSHYLDLDRANKMDKISMETIENNDKNKIMTFTNDNLDSPISVVTILKMMDKAGMYEKTVLNHSNSELILKKKVDETTSYVTYLFY